MAFIAGFGGVPRSRSAAACANKFAGVADGRGLGAETRDAEKTKLAAMAKSVAVVYGTKGGLGDVGKCAVWKAVQVLGAGNVRVVAMSKEREEGTDKGFDPDIKHEKTAKEVRNTLTGMDVLKLDAEAEDTESRLAHVFSGVSAVISCVGNRQGTESRWTAIGAAKVLGAMKAAGTSRLVQLSSVGVGEDFMPDLIVMEDLVEKSDRDYVFVRPMGLEPGVVPRGEYKTLHSTNDGGLEALVAKPDAAQCMLDLALADSPSRTGVTVGYGK